MGELFTFSGGYWQDIVDVTCSWFVQGSRISGQSWIGDHDTNDIR
jgi:hypothetical protein